MSSRISRQNSAQAPTCCAVPVGGGSRFALGMCSVIPFRIAERASAQRSGERWHLKRLRMCRFCRSNWHGGQRFREGGPHDQVPSLSKLLNERRQPRTATGFRGEVLLAKNCPLESTWSNAEANEPGRSVYVECSCTHRPLEAGHLLMTALLWPVVAFFLTSASKPTARSGAPSIYRPPKEQTPA